MPAPSGDGPTPRSSRLTGHPPPTRRRTTLRRNTALRAESPPPPARRPCRPCRSAASAGFRRFRSLPAAPAAPGAPGLGLFRRASALPVASDAPTAPGAPPAGRRSRWLVPLAIAVAAVICLIAAFGAGSRAHAELTRKPTAAELSAAAALGVASRWQRWPAGQIFPAAAVLHDGPAEPRNGASGPGSRPATGARRPWTPRWPRSPGVTAAGRRCGPATWISLGGVVYTLGVLAFPEPARGGRVLQPLFGRPDPGPRPACAGAAGYPGGGLHRCGPAGGLGQPGRSLRGAHGGGLRGRPASRRDRRTAAVRVRPGHPARDRDRHAAGPAGTVRVRDARNGHADPRAAGGPRPPQARGPPGARARRPRRRTRCARLTRHGSRARRRGHARAAGPGSPFQCAGDPSRVACRVIAASAVASAVLRSAGVAPGVRSAEQAQLRAVGATAAWQ